MTLALAATPAAKATGVSTATASRLPVSTVTSWALVICFLFMTAVFPECCLGRALRSGASPRLSSEAGLPTEAGADADRAVVATDRATHGERGAIADRTLVADRQRGLAVLGADADADAVLRAHAGGAGGHVEHRRAHRALAVDALVLFAEALFDIAAQLQEVVVPRGEAGIGVGVGGAQRLRGGGVGVGARRRQGGGIAGIGHGLGLGDRGTDHASDLLVGVVVGLGDRGGDRVVGHGQ